MFYATDFISIGGKTTPKGGVDIIKRAEAKILKINRKFE